MELYVFDRNLNFIGITESFNSLIWVRRYNKSGDFELNCSLTDSDLSLLARGNIIYKKGDTEAGYIEYRNLKQDTEGKEVLVIKGKFLTSYFNRRLIWDTIVSINSEFENVMRSLVDRNCISPSIVERKIPNLILGVAKGYPNTMNYQISYANLSEELENISALSNLGYRVNLDIPNKRLVFEVYKGIDRSASQSVNQRCIFSKEFDNILEQEYTDSLNNYKNLCLIGGTGDGYARKLVTVGNSIGLDRYEIFNDQQSLSNEVDNVVMTDADYTNLLIGKGNETLAGTNEIQTFVNKINLNSNLKYKIDFNLGDIVTIVSKKWNITIDSRIIEIEEAYEADGLTVSATFGANIPTFIDKIKAMNKEQTSSGGTTSSKITSIDGGRF